MNKLIWLDLETTGLDPDSDIVLEVAIVVTDANLKELGTYQAVVQRPQEELAGRNINAFVQRMHTENGLWAALKDGKKPEHVAKEMDNFAIFHKLYKGMVRGRPPILSGNSVHFDRRFLRRFCPAFEKNLGHQHLDASALINAVNAWQPGSIDWPRSTRHRAMDDVEMSIAQAGIVKTILEGK